MLGGGSLGKGWREWMSRNGVRTYGDPVAQEGVCNEVHGELVFLNVRYDICWVLGRLVTLTTISLFQEANLG